jgi:hypothetical protein
LQIGKFCPAFEFSSTEKYKVYKLSSFIDNQSKSNNAAESLPCIALYCLALPCLAGR